MKIKINFEKIGIIALAVISGLYALFLVLPFIISPIANKFCNQIEELIKVSTGLEAHVQGIGIITSPGLSVGLKVKEFSVYVPNEKVPVIDIDNLKGDLLLVPLLAKKIQFGTISAEEIETNIVLDKKGIPVIIKYLPEQNDENEGTLSSLPLGLKLSNHFPNIIIEDYRFSFIDEATGSAYYIDGEDLKITDFILDKKLKISTTGQIVFDKRVVSNYDIKIFNRIMPDWKLDDLVFPKEVKIEDEKSVKKNEVNSLAEINIIDFFKAVNKNGFKADINADIKTSGTFKKPVQKGLFEIVGLSVFVNGKQLPESYAKFHFKGEETDIDSIFYTSSDINEKTQLIGNIKTGDTHSLDITLRSNAKFNNIIRLLDSIASSLGRDDLKTVSATGAIDADFNVSSDMRTIISNGHLKIKPSTLSYALYNVYISNINADIDFDNNNININNIGFSVFGHPFKIVGELASNAVADIKITADNLPIKGLVGIAGQIGLLKENDFNSGSLTLNAIIKGALNEIKPDVMLSIDNVNIYNKMLQTRLLLTKAIVKLLLSKTNINGDVDINSLKLKHDMASVSVPSALVYFDSKDINIKNSYVMINNSKIDVKGSVKDYTTKNLNMDISAKGDLASVDVAAFIPRELHSMFPYTGKMPLSIILKGDANTQHITFDLSATPSAYVKFLDINKLKGKNTKIHTDVKLENNSATLVNSGIFANAERIATFDGGVNNLSNPDLSINISIPQKISFPIPGMGANSNITGYGAFNFGGSPLSPKLKGKVYLDDISIKDMDFELKNLIANLNGQGISGDGTAEKMRFGGIVASNLVAKFILNDFTVFNLSDIKADVFSGKVSGKLTYHIPTFLFGLDLEGKGLNSMDAVYGTVGIPKALTGTLGFGVKLTSKGVTDTEIIKNLKGDINFNITNGRFVSIGRLENLVAAQNISSNSILKSAISALTTAANIQETDKFKLINGEMTMSNGSVNILFINVSGPLMSYYIKGVYNILQNSANLVILGRLDSKVVSYLGPIGQLSAEKLLSYIPKFGASTAKFLDILTQDPKNEKTELIPELSSGSKSYKDFKVIYNGSIEKASSIKTFKWLSKCDTSQMDLKQEVKNAVNAAKDNVKSQVESAKTTANNIKTNVTKIVETQKQQVKTEKQSLEQAKKDVQNIKQNASQSATNLGNLLKNAALNANKKLETSQPAASQTNSTTQNIPAAQTTTQTTIAHPQTETKTESQSREQASKEE